MSLYFIHTCKYTPAAGETVLAFNDTHSLIEYFSSIAFDYEPQKDKYPARAFRKNQYIVNITNDSVERLRFVVNQIVLAESYLLPNDVFPYVLVYEVKEGERLDENTQMQTLFNVEVRTKDGFKWVQNGFNQSSGHNPGVQHHLRGSGRYMPVLVKDTPEQFGQRLNAYTARHSDELRAGEFVGLEVAFCNYQGKARKFLYQGAPFLSDFFRNETGAIVYHKGGHLNAGRWRLYKQAIDVVAPLFAPYTFDKDGYIVACPKIADYALANGVSELKTQMHRTKDRGPWFPVFKRQLIKLLLDYAYCFAEFTHDINAWCHNVNYSVSGYRRSKILYQKGEAIVRYIVSMFPNQLDYSGRAFSDAYNLTPPNDDKYLLLRFDTDDTIAAFDAMCKIVDWMHANYVEYDSITVPPDIGEPYIGGDNWFVSYTFVPPHYYYVNRRPVVYGSGGVGEREAPPNYMGEGNHWRWRTSGTASDIEQSFLTFQWNARKFINSFAHFLRRLDASSYFPHGPQKGPFNGTAKMTDEMKKNRRRVNPTSIGYAVPVRRTEEEQTSEAEKQALPNFATLQTDERGIIRRCDKDATDKEKGEEEEDDIDAPDFDEEREEVRKRSREDMKKVKKRRAQIEWRNEIDPLDPIEVENERIRMYNQQINNVGMVLDVAEVAIDAATVIAAPEVTPAIMYKESTGGILKKILRKVAEDVVEDVAESEFQPQIPEVEPPEGTEKAPDEHDYEPPEPEDEDIEETGDEEAELPEEGEVEEGPCFFINDLGETFPRRYKLKHNGMSRDFLEGVEPSLGRILIQTGVHFLEELIPGTDCPETEEEDSRERYICMRHAYRLPRPIV